MKQKKQRLSKMTDEKLEEIKNLLQDIKELLIITNLDKIEEAKKKLVKTGSVEEKILKLCDGRHTTQDIANKTQKSTDYVSATVSTLREKGLVSTLKKNDKIVHIQRF